MCIIDEYPGCSVGSAKTVPGTFIENLRTIISIIYSKSHAIGKGDMNHQ